MFPRRNAYAAGELLSNQPPVNKNLEDSLFLGTLAPGARCRKPHPLSWMRFLDGIASLLVVSLSIGEASQGVKLAWDANAESDIAGYVLRYGTARGKPSQSIDVGKTATATVSNLADGTTYFFTVTARNTLGLESPPSNEVSYTTAPLGAHPLTVINGTGTGNYTESTRVTVSASAPAAGQQFDRWTGDWQILDNPLSSTTTALMLFRNLEISASYRSNESNDTIRYLPLAGYGDRMVGGVFEGTNGDPVEGPYTPIYTITATPPDGWSEVSVSLGSYRYLRYRGAPGSYGTVVEIQFYRAGVKLEGTGYGSPGSWVNGGSTFDKALDGDSNTYFNGPAPVGNYVGLDTAAIANKIRFLPLAGYGDENGGRSL